MRILYTVEDGTVRTFNPNTKEKYEEMLGPLTEEAYKALAWDKGVPQNAINPVWVEESVIPKNREFRNAWKQDGSNVNHDLEKVKSIQIERTESAIKPIMQALNSDLIEAIVSGNSVAQALIMAKKDRLSIGLNTLKAIIPESIEQIKASTPILDDFR